MNQRDLIRLTLLLIVLGVDAVLTHYAFDRDTTSPLLDCVTAGSFSVIVIAAILFIQACVCGRRDIPQKHPRLSIETVFIYVYGLGLIIFVTIYSVMGVSGDASMVFYLQISAIAFDDMLQRTKDGTLRRSLLFFGAVLAAASLSFTNLSARGIGETIQAVLDQQWFVIIHGLILPATIPWFFFAIRGKRFYNPVTIYDFLYFGMPFATILALTALAGLTLLSRAPSASLNATLPRFANATASDKLVTAADVAAPLLCINMLPTVFLAIQSTLLYSTVDFVVVAAFVASVKAMAEYQPTPLLDAAFVSATVALAVRLYACYRDESDKCSVAYTRENEEDEEEDRMLEKIRTDVQIQDA